MSLSEDCQNICNNQDLCDQESSEESHYTRDDEVEDGMMDSGFSVEEN